MDHILRKLEEAEILNDPFPHLQIDSFLPDSLFQVLLADDQLHFTPASNTQELHDALVARDFQIQGFPGCITEIRTYLKYESSGNWPSPKQGLGGTGLAYRLQSYRNEQLRELMAFLNSPIFETAIKNKFGITADTEVFSAVQKYLSKYHISPHPDIREKCVTYLLNVNKYGMEQADIHTHLLRFKSEYNWVPNWWESHQEFNTCWIPWEWCESVKQISANNCMVMFPTNNYSLHAIRLEYDHNRSQRTQIYGNLMQAGVRVGEINKMMPSHLTMRKEEPKM